MDEVPLTEGRFDHYEIATLENGTFVELGRGGMGVTYRATDTTLRCAVALKVVNPVLARDARIRARFLREARAAAGLRHPHVASVFFFGERASDRQLFYAMELVEGETLQARVRRCGGLLAEQVLEIGVQIADALAAAEAGGLTHRDLKPANLMLVNGDAVNVKIIDFGLAKAAAGEHAEGAALTQTQEFVGTPAFASPEHFNVWQEVDVRSDFYALGATLWYALTGHAPFAGRTAGEINMQQLGNALPLDQLRAAHVPRPLAELLRTLLSAKPAGRPQTAGALLAALADCRGRVGLVTRNSLTRRRLLVLAGLAAGLITAAIVAGWIIHARSPRPVVAAAPVAPAPVVLEKSIAVLPFRNLSADKDNAFFADGIQDEVLTDLAKVADLKVVSRSSVMQYQDADRRNLREIGQRLGVAHLLEGSVQRAGNRVRVTAQLIDARTDAHQWAEHFDRPLDDLFTIQSEIAQAIVGQLQAAISPQAHAAIDEAPTHDLKAYELYLRAHTIWTGSPSSDYQSWLDQIISLLMEATQRDPQFARAYALLAQVQGLTYKASDPTPAREVLVRRSIEAVARLRPGSADFHKAMGSCAYLVDRDYARAHDEFVQTVRLVPNDAEAFHFLAVADRYQALWDDALTHFRKAAELDPQDANAPADYIETLMALGRYPEAVPIIDHLANAHPDDASLPMGVQMYKARLLLNWKADSHGALVALATVPASYDPAGSITAMRVFSDDCAQNFAAADRDLAACSLQEIKEDPRAWYEGFNARYRGDQQAAEKAFLTARLLLMAKINAAPDDADRLMSLAWVDAALGRKANAVAEARRAAAKYPLDRDAWAGPVYAGDLAVVLAMAGEREEAISLVQTLCAHPNGPSYGYLKLHPDWDALRGDPRFEAAVASVAPKP